MTRWLITGGCGFIGRNLIRCLQEQTPNSHAVRILDNLSVGSQDDLAKIGTVAGCSANEVQIGPTRSALELIEGDILDLETVLQACKGVDVIVHLAANTGVAPSVEDPRSDCETNVIGTLNCLEAARRHGIGRFVFASSGAPIGETEPPIHEEKAPHPVSPYGASKLAGEGYCSCYYRTFGVETVALRFGNVYGPGSKHKNSVIAKFIRLALEGQALEIYGDGRQTRDFIYIDDLVAAINQAATLPDIGGEVFQIATSRECTVNEIADALTKALEEAGVQMPKISYGVARQGDVLRNFSDTTKARERLDWQAGTTVDQGLARTVRWFLDQAEPQLSRMVGGRCTPDRIRPAAR